MDDKIKVLIVDDIKETRNNIRTLLQFNDRIETIGEGENGDEAVIAVSTLKPDIVLMDINMPVKDGIKATEEIALNWPDVSVIIISVQGEQEYLRKAMSAGARDFITKPFSGDDLVNTIIKTFEYDKKRKEKAVPVQHEEFKSKVITVFSTKGGVGKTAVAVNLAVSLAKNTGKKVALLDFDLQFGNAGVFLNVQIKNTIVDLVKESVEIDSKLIEEYLTDHYSGVKILLPPIKPEYAEFITPNHIEKIVNTLKENYHYIVIDTSSVLNEVSLLTLDLADKILFVTQLELPTIKNTKQGIELLETLHYSREKICMVVNKYNEQLGIKPKDFEDTVKYPIWASIPNDEMTVSSSINKGFPFALTRIETRVSKSISDISNELSNKTSNKEEQHKGIFKSLFK